MNKLIPYGRSNLMLRKPVDHIGVEDVKALLRAIDLWYERSAKTKNNQWIRDRDKLLLHMMWVTGARITDVLNMQTDKMNYRTHTLTFLIKKRKDKKKDSAGKIVRNEDSEPILEDHWHRLRIDNETYSQFNDYIQTWSIKGFVFRKALTKNKPLKRQYVNWRLNELCKLIDHPHVHPHEFRHGAAMYMQAKGTPIEIISYHLGHSDTSITLKTYARIDAEQEYEFLESVGVRLRISEDDDKKKSVI